MECDFMEIFIAELLAADMFLKTWRPRYHDGIFHKTCAWESLHFPQIQAMDSELPTWGISKNSISTNFF